MNLAQHLQSEENTAVIDNTEKLSKFTVAADAGLLTALSQIDSNKLGFVIVVDRTAHVQGVLTDGDVRRALISGKAVQSSIEDIFNKAAATVHVSEGFEKVTELFKNPAIKFLPIVDDKDKLVNLITKSQFHTYLLQDIQGDLYYDFPSLDTKILDSEIFNRPWGFYKTTVLTDYYQAKVLTIKPGAQLSLQSHQHREEYWIVVHGRGTVNIDGSEVSVSTGSTVFIPKQAKHRLTNTDETESLIITEVQIGDYLGEDDITRYEDVYGRV